MGMDGWVREREIQNFKDQKQQHTSVKAFCWAKAGLWWMHLITRIFLSLCCRCFYPVFFHIQMLWELVLLGEALVVMAPSPAESSDTVLALVRWDKSTLEKVHAISADQVILYRIAVLDSDWSESIHYFAARPIADLYDCTLSDFSLTWPAVYFILTSRVKGKNGTTGGDRKYMYDWRSTTLSFKQIIVSNYTRIRKCMMYFGLVMFLRNVNVG